MKKLVLKRIVLALAVGAVVAMLLVAWAPKGQLGYEGQPGNQGGFHQAGTTSYEGQPGNQSHNH